MTDHEHDPITGEDVRALRDETHTLAASVDKFATKAQVAEVRRLANRANINSTLAVLALVLACIVAFIGWQSNSSTLDRFEADRLDRSRGSCVQFNVNQHNQRDAIVNGLVDTFRPLVQPGREAELDTFAASLRTNVDNQLPYRDCSDAGIEAFLRNPPQDPANGGG
jgi:hypothetical protein